MTKIHVILATLAVVILFTVIFVIGFRYKKRRKPKIHKSKESHVNIVPDEYKQEIENELHNGLKKPSTELKLKGTAEQLEQLENEKSSQDEDKGNV